MSARRDAIFALGLWLTRGDRPTQALPPGPDHAFALELVGAALRHKASLEWAIGRCCRPPRGELLAALLIGAAQLLVLPGVPDHAAIAETVEACKPIGKGAARFVNAVLRRLQRRLSIPASHPPLSSDHSQRSNAMRPTRSQPSPARS